MVTRDRVLLGVLGAATLIAAASVWMRRSDGVGATGAPGTTAAGPAGNAVPRIGLDRLEHRSSSSEAGKRDLFEFGAAPASEAQAVAPEVAQEVPTEIVPVAPTPTPLPPLSVKYIGSAESRGVRVAFFMTDKREVLTGQVGDTVMNRFRVVKIGFESVDVQQVGFDQVQRIPLRGN